ncbi:MAG TPA: hypothetical protein VJP04_00360, partial [Terriglobales bacterium]|nr:hypothetical protein [Terriglobales bacterium]
AGSGQFKRGSNQPVARPNNPQPSSQPARAERQAPQSSGGGRQVQSRESGSSQQHGKQESKGESKQDKQH